MFKKLLLIFFILFNFLININVFADSIPVENVFSDINIDYKYLNELQTLYDKGMVAPDFEGKFNPYQLLTREEFVGITMEVSCKECIKPDVDYSFIQKYNREPFYDVGLENKYFYCIADAKNSNYVKGYDASFTCGDGTYIEGDTPFCVKNNIVLEEALAIILRVSGILTNSEAQNIRNDIFNGLITENLSDDVSPKNLDGTVYSFYPDFMKALEYEVVEFDELGNKSTYHLVEVVDGKLRPKKNITKEEFLRIAFVALKANNCLEKTDISLGLQMKIYDYTCSENSTNCELSNLDTDDKYDFEANVDTTCESGVKVPEGYIWRFYHENTGEEDIKYGRYMDDYVFENQGMRQIYLRVIDNCGNTSEVYNTLDIDSENDLLVSIDADPIYGTAPLKVDLEGIVIGTNGPYSYEWDFGNGEIGFGKNVEVIYKNDGLYEVILKVTDKDGNIQYAKVFIKVDDYQELLDNLLDDESLYNLNNDTDLDGIIDIEDDCPLIKGEIENNGCPILSETCSNNNDCQTGYECNISNSIGICKPNTLSNNSCNYSGGTLISGNIICESCPCNNYLDYISTLRKCDVIFPAITSPDNSIIYSKGDFYKIK